MTIGSYVYDIYVCIRTHRHFMSHMTSILTEIQYIEWCKKTGKVLRNLMKLYIMSFQHDYSDCINFGINQIKITEMINLLKSHVIKLNIVK